MNSETKICQSCKKEFVIESEDFAFYAKINVTAPNFCSECRQKRRYSWRNERVLYRRNCDLCSKSSVTIYSPNKPYKVYCPPCWWGDGWDAGVQGHDFDFTRPFFEQFYELQLQVPRIALLSKNSINSDYTNHSGNNKNCYLSFGVFDAENVLYSANIYPGRDICDCYRVEKGSNELLYECMNATGCFGCQYSFLIRDCINCYYCYDAHGSSNCFMSFGLRNKQYYIRNVQYSKEEYQQTLVKLNLGSHETRRKLYDEYVKLLQEKALHRFATIEQSSGCSGNFIFNSKNTQNSFDATDAEDSRHIIVAPDVKDSMDAYHFGFKCELIYESHALVRAYNNLFCHLSYDNSNISYCDSCHNSENLFGCVGIRKKKYCIFNKQYTEEEYKVLKEKIITHMRGTHEYGEFFPVNCSPFGYNETQGNVYMPMAKTEALQRGYKWEDRIPGTFGKETKKPEAIANDIKNIDDAITKEVLVCVSCSKNYNIVPTELVLYKKMNVPIPRLCPDCRYMRRIAIRPPRKLWHRRCVCDYVIYKNSVNHAHHPEDRCLNVFETSYAPDRPEIVYCEQCYHAEII